MFIKNNLYGIILKDGDFIIQVVEMIIYNNVLAATFVNEFSRDINIINLFFIFLYI